ncbi:MAG: tetratricopeptide repeat protein, partial [Gammaproteobacteria bacterium]
LSRDPAKDYFADGLTDEIIRNLSVIDGLVVRSRTSSFAFKGKVRAVREAGRQLDATHILEGSVLLSGQQLRINATLVRVRDDFPLWSGKYDRELTDVFAIQEEISRSIVNQLRLKLGRGRRRYETSVEVYDLYLRARALQVQRHLTGYVQSAAPLEQAVAKDPSFAPAHAALASAYAVRSSQALLEKSPDELVRMRAAAERAIQLDPLLAEAHDALGVVHARDGQWEKSENSFRRAIELDPSRSTTYTNFALRLLTDVGRIEEALGQLRVAVKADPLSPEVHLALAWVLGITGRYDEVAGHCNKLPEDHPIRKRCLARARLGQGRFEEAIELHGNDRSGYLGFAYARSGRREEAEKLAATIRHPFHQALIFAGLGDKERTFEALDRLAVLGPQMVGGTLVCPELALLRGDPRVKLLRKKVGLPE